MGNRKGISGTLYSARCVKGTNIRDALSGGLVNCSPVLLRSLVFNGGVVPENVRLAYAANKCAVIELKAVACYQIEYMSKNDMQVMSRL
jgi:hypothetical protein